MDHGNADYTYISFEPGTPNMELIKKKWDQIVLLMPEHSEPAEPSIFGDDFQEEFAPEEKDVMRARIERRLALIDVSPEVRQELKQQLDELRSI